MNTQRVEFPLLLLILITGAFMRFYGFPNIPFTYDELSAWGRTGYRSFSELIRNGVRGDGHPALIQVFLNYWRMFLGDSEAAFKLPFLLMGIASIFLVYLIGKQWFNATTALLCAAFVAVLQYTVVHAQIARPYGSGLFFVLCMVWFWNRYFFDGYNKRNLAGFSAFAVLCCYNHYFSFLVALEAGLTGLFLLPKQKWREYILAGAAIVLLFLPHAGITMDQLALGGVGGWLSKPDRFFLWNYLDYVFHFSWRVKEVVLVLVLLGFIFSDPGWKQKNKYRFIALAWFLVPVITGYLYSRYRNPVLQYSVLIFSFPFLLLLLFSFFRELKPLLLVAVVLVVLSVGGYSLIMERKHYAVFCHQPVEQMVMTARAVSAANGDKKTAAVIAEPSKYMGYYLLEEQENLTVASYGELQIPTHAGVRDYFKSLEADLLVLGNIPYDHLRLAMQFYPYLLEQHRGFTYDLFVLSRDPQPVASGILQESRSLMPDSSSGTNGKPWVVRFGASREFGPAVTDSLLRMVHSRDDILMVVAEAEGITDSVQASVVLSFRQGDRVVYWDERPFHFFINPGDSSGLAVLALRIRDYPFAARNPVLETYVWNKNKESFYLNRFSVEVMKGNPLIYGLIEPVPAAMENPF